MSEMNFDKPPVLKTARLELKQVCEKDVDIIFAFNADSEALRYVARVPYKTQQEARDKVGEFMAGIENKTAIWWIFRLRETGQSMGCIGLFDFNEDQNSAEIGYGMVPEFWGQGYITEIVEEIVRFGFELLGLNSIYGLVVPGNTASEKVLIRHGFKLEELLKNHTEARGESFDMQKFVKTQQIRN
ncbi:MAG: GNAT family N-acetyltransferase [bacterium]|nr:GNAT family N-acetyltransferase [bacterium]